MDYIQEELRRQERALARLLLGASAEPEKVRKEAEDGERFRGEGAGAFPKRRGPSPLPAEAISAGGGAFPSPAGGETAAGAWAEDAGEEVSPWPEGFAEEELFPWPETGRRADSGGGEGPLPLPAEAGEAAAVNQSREAEGDFPARVSSGGALAAEAGRRRVCPPEETALPRRQSAGESPAAGIFRYGQAGLGPELSVRAAAMLSAEGEEAAMRVEEPLSPAGAAADSARELSRVFQRDARRYDGAFEMF